MRLTYTDFFNQFLRNINQPSSTSDTTLVSSFNYYLGTRYQLILAKLKNFKTATNTTFSTIASTQYYSYPLGFISTDGMYITIGSVSYPLIPISSLLMWEKLNAIQIQTSAIPQFYFPRRDDFGIWPIPQAVYTGTHSYHYRDRNLLVSDYTTGSVTLTLNSTTLTGSGTTFTPAMVGRWFSVTSTTVLGEGYWIRISGYTSATVLTLSQAWPNATTSGASYRIGETPEIPEELHEILLAGVMADYYTWIQKDTDNAQLFSNIFYTGDPQNKTRKEGDSTIAGGLIGGMNRYADRDDQRIIKRSPHLNTLRSKVFAVTLS